LALRPSSTISPAITLISFIIFRTGLPGLRDEHGSMRGDAVIGRDFDFPPEGVPELATLGLQLAFDLLPTNIATPTIVRLMFVCSGGDEGHFDRSRRGEAGPKFALARRRRGGSQIL